MVDNSDIRARREKLGLSEEALAKLAGNGVTQQVVHRLETGETKTSKHTPAIRAALEAEERRRASPPVPVPDAAPEVAKGGLPEADVLAALEVLMHILCKSDIAAREAAGALLAAIQAPPPPPLGTDRQTVIRIETQRIASQFSQTVQ